MGLLNYLAPERKRQNALADALRRKSMADNAPVNALGAPGGLLAMPRPDKPGSALGGLLAASSVVPGIGDFTGPMADAHMYATDPSSRTPGNYAMSLAGLLPFVPSMAAMTKGADGVARAFLKTDGSPLDLYHGTQKQFDNFAVDPDGMPGVWFSDSQSYAHDISRGGWNVSDPDLSKGRVITANISAKNPKEYDILEEARKVAEQIGVDPPADSFAAQELLAGGIGWDEVVAEIADEARREGHDALILRNFNDNRAMDTTAYVVFDPKLIRQVKK